MLGKGTSLDVEERESGKAGGGKGPEHCFLVFGHWGKTILPHGVEEGPQGRISEGRRNSRQKALEKDGRESQVPQIEEAQGGREGTCRGEKRSKGEEFLWGRGGSPVEGKKTLRREKRNWGENHVHGKKKEEKPMKKFEIRRREGRCGVHVRP